MADPTAYGTTVADAAATVTFAGLVKDLVHRPVSAYWTKHTQKQGLISRLGQWAAEAFDKQDRRLQPVLSLEAFRKHLIDNDGHCRPSGECTSNLAWAQMLYALGICPGADVLAWRLASANRDPTTTGVIDLEVEGSVLVDIVNLYRIYGQCQRTFVLKKPDGDALTPLRAQNSDVQDRVNMFYTEYNDLKFGVLDFVVSRPNNLHCVFTPGVERDLRTCRAPFITAGHQQRPIPFDSGTAIAKYLQCQELGVSDSKQVLPSPRASLEERVSALVSIQAGIAVPQKGRAPELALASGLISSCALYTTTWLEEASRISRRATTNGGTDNSLRSQLLEAMRDLPISAYPTRASSGRTSDPTEASYRQIWQQEAFGRLEMSVMHEGHPFAMQWPRGKPLYYTPLPSFEVNFEGFSDELCSLLRPALRACIERNVVAWASILGPVPTNSVIELMRIPHMWTVSNDSLVLPLDRRSPLWNMGYIIIRG